MRDVVYLIKYYIFYSVIIIMAPFSYGDDSEIFFNIDESVKPNIIFLIDRSSSASLEEDGVMRITIVKQALQKLLSEDNSIHNLRMGLMSFYDSWGLVDQAVIDIDQIDTTKDPARTEKNGRVTLKQIITHKVNAGVVQAAEAGYNGKMSFGDERVIMDWHRILFALRFDNILVENIDGTGIDQSSVKATLELSFVNKAKVSGDLLVYTDSDINAGYMDNNEHHYIAKKIASIGDHITYSISEAQDGYVAKIDVSEIIRNKIADPNWKSDNAIAFYFDRKGSPVFEISLSPSPPVLYCQLRLQKA